MCRSLRHDGADGSQRQDVVDHGRHIAVPLLHRERGAVARFAALAFEVQWGNPLGAALIMVTFSLVGTGAGMLIGTTFSNAEQAAGLSVTLK